MKTSKLKRLVSILLCFVIFNSFCSVNTYAANSGSYIYNNPRFSVNISSSKDQYEKGETIEIYTDITNKSYCDLNELVAFVEYDGDVCLKSGIAERECDPMAMGEYYFAPFELVENENNENIYNIPVVGKMLTSFIKTFLKIYMSISHIIVSLRQKADNVKVNFINLFLFVNTSELGKIKIKYDGKDVELTVKLSYVIEKRRNVGTIHKESEHDDSFITTADVKAASSGFNGIVFGADSENSDFNGGLFFLDADKKYAGIAYQNDDGVTIEQKKHIDIKPDSFYKVKLQYDKGYIKAWVYTNPLDSDPYPVADVYVKTAGNIVGTYSQSDGNVKNIAVKDIESNLDFSDTYTNPVCEMSADPFIYYEDGTYYLYATNIFKVYTSTDLVNWTDRGQCANINDLLGEVLFYAPEVYKYKGSYYMFYAADEQMTVAKADSPLGPFKKTSDKPLLPDGNIDGTLLFDDDKIYMYYAKFTENGEELWVCELNDDLISVKPNTETKLTQATEKWEGDINEGPAVLKHNGLYYLTYSSGCYSTAHYTICYAVSDSPTGPFVKDKLNPVYQFTASVYGPGHHCFVYSPSGEMYIAYHGHRISTAEPYVNRKLYIDKVKFVPDESGVDRLEIYGPTVTPQKKPK